MAMFVGPPHFSIIGMPCLQMDHDGWFLQGQLETLGALASGTPFSSVSPSQEVLEEMPEDPVRLQMLLHHRDKQLDDLAERFKDGQRLGAPFDDLPKCPGRVGSRFYLFSRHVPDCIRGSNALLTPSSQPAPPGAAERARESAL